MRLRFVVLAALCAATLALPAWAHHSHNNYATSEFTFIEGTVKEIHFLNPHSWVYMEVKNKAGEPELWALEAIGLDAEHRYAGMGIVSAYFSRMGAGIGNEHILLRGAAGVDAQQYGILA